MSMLPPDGGHLPPRAKPLPPAPEADRPRLDASLRVENILIKEFDYASLTAYQVYENRERIFNFYFTLMGALLSGLGALYQISRNSNTDWRPLAVALLIAGALLSAIFYVRLIHLRQSLRDSIITTYVIKEFYIKQFAREIPNIETAFRWRLATLPSGERPSSDTSFILYPIGGIGALAFATATLLLTQSWADHGLLRLPVVAASVAPWTVAAVVALVVVLIEWLFYRSQLSVNRELRILEQQALQLGISLGDAGKLRQKTLLEQLLFWGPEQDDLR